MAFRPGKPVMARATEDRPWEPAEIVYQRMAGPDYREVAAYSVSMESRASDPTYSGTIVSPRNVRDLDPEEF